MKKNLFKKLAAVVLTGAMSLSLMACGGAGEKKSESNGSGGGADAVAASDTYGIDKELPIGVLVSDTTSSEALAFRSYYTDYIGKQYKVKFIYSDELKDAAGETTALENFINQGVKAVISLSSFDRPAQLDTCEDAGIYYSIAAGTLTEQEYEVYKDYEYYVGSIGPSLKTEANTGYDMAKNYIDQGKTSFLIFGGAAAFGTEMHIYRVAGMLAAMCEADSSTNYDGATDIDGIVEKIGGTSPDVKKFKSDKFKLDYMDGYNMDDAWFGMIAEKVSAEGLEAVLAVGNGGDFFSTQIQGKDIKVASVDSFTEDYGKAFDAGTLDWLAGKFNASIAPIFAATVNAVNGAKLKTPDGGALMIDQGYWEAADKDSFGKYLAKVLDADNPAYTKAILDKYIATSDQTVKYEDFEKFVKAYSYDEIDAMNE